MLDRIKNSGDIFWAQSDREWILDGAMVHVSMIGFDEGSQKTKILDDEIVPEIYSNLTSQVDLTIAESLIENSNLAFIGTQKGGPFDISKKEAQEMLEDTNPSNLPNSDVIKPWINGSDITQNHRNRWIIDFGVDMSIEEASKYLEPYKYVKKNVKPKRDKVRRKRNRELWWLFSETRPGMRNAISNLSRIIVTPRVSKHRVFVFQPIEVIPDSAVVVIARDDFYFFGTLHSKIHELWTRGTGTQLREAESGFRYSQTLTFETFPFPWSPGEEPKEGSESFAAIAKAAHDLVSFRQSWLHPPEEDIGVIIGESMLKRRTLTNLYNALTHYGETVKGKQRNRTQWDMAIDYISLDKIETLDYIHTQLDNAVFDAYGWDHSISDEQILENLLSLNEDRVS